MKKVLAALTITLVVLAGNLNAQVIIENLDLRGTGVFGFGAMGTQNHQNNVTGATFNGGAFPGGSRAPAEPIDIALTYNNLDLDADASANDSVTFTVRWEKIGTDGGDLASLGQGIDTGFGNLNDMQVSVMDVSGATTDSGSTIYFDGFTGATLGAGSTTGTIDRTAEINGTTITFTNPTSGVFEFFQDGVDFTEPVATLLIDNSGDTDFDGNGDGGDGSIVARAYDLQFSLNEPVGGVPGDFNNDNIVDDADIDLLSAQIGQSASVDPRMDIDNDTNITLADHDAHIQTLVMDANGTGAIIGDLNLDGDVDVSQIAVVGGQVVNTGDASVLLASLGQTSGQLYADGDLNGDGDVDVSQISVVGGQVVNQGDASILLASLGQTTATGGTPAASAVPEPGSLAVLTIVGIGAAIRRRK